MTVAVNGDDIRDRVVGGAVVLTALLVLVRWTGIVGWPWVWSFAPVLALIGVAVFGSALALLWVLAGVLLRGRQ